ncbi:hypothetical protein B0H11DRAFT_2324718 [Mycena galericulata]|nr:hypothetical protein B0H11DRAFT_2324718 [Mycena galericulata]
MSRGPILELAVPDVHPEQSDQGHFIWRIAHDLMWQQEDRKIDELFEVLLAFRRVNSPIVDDEDQRIFTIYRLESEARLRTCGSTIRSLGSLISGSDFEAEALNGALERITNLDKTVSTEEANLVKLEEQKETAQFANVHDVSWGTKGDNKVSTDSGTVATKGRRGRGGCAHFRERHQRVRGRDTRSQHQGAQAGSKPDAATQQEDIYRTFRTNYHLKPLRWPKRIVRGSLFIRFAWDVFKSQALQLQTVRSRYKPVKRKASSS